MKLIPVPESWRRVLPQFVEVEENPEHFPEYRDILKALELTPLNEVKVVILGREPYIQKGMSNGLAFGVNKGIPRPPALRNIMKELESDLGIEVDPTATTLTGWAKQGVLLLNMALTVEQGRSGGHDDRWNVFTKTVFQGVVDHRHGVVFMLWGREAIALGSVIHYGHLTPLMAAHPASSAQTAYWGCKHFSQANQLLKKIGREPIDWSKIDAEG